MPLKDQWKRVFANASDEEIIEQMKQKSKLAEDALSITDGLAELLGERAAERKPL